MTKSQRQQYGLGSFVKKAFKKVKKAVKSPLGKAALLGGLGMWGMGAGPFSGLKGSGWLKRGAGFLRNKAIGAATKKAALGTMRGAGPLHGATDMIPDDVKIKTKSPEELAAEAKAARTKKLNKYLDTMGYDKAKKTAMGDALIDASAIVQNATDEAGSLKKADWGKLINRAIQTTSKRLDKPEQIREAVGLMMTKGEIEKDIAAGKGGALKQNARDLVAAGVYKTEKEAMAHLGKVGSFEDTMAALASKTGNVTGDMIKVAWISDQKKPPRDHFKSTDKDGISEDFIQFLKDVYK